MAELPGYLAWSLAWAVLYLVINLICKSLFQNGSALRKKIDTTALSTRLASLLHAVVVVSAVITSYFQDEDGFKEENLVHSRCTTLMSIIPCSVGFMFLDTALTIWIEVRGNKQSDFWTMIGHHIITVVAELTFVEKKLFAGIVRLLLLTEVTTPILNVRWTLIELGGSATSVTVVSVLLLLSFIVFRVVGGLQMLLMIHIIGLETMWAESQTSTMVLVTTVVAFFALNLYWTGLMISKAFEVFVRKGNSKGADIKEHTS